MPMAQMDMRACTGRGWEWPLVSLGAPACCTQPCGRPETCAAARVRVSSLVCCTMHDENAAAALRLRRTAPGRPVATGSAPALPPTTPRPCTAEPAARRPSRNILDYCLPSKRVVQSPALVGGCVVWSPALARHSLGCRCLQRLQKWLQPHVVLLDVGMATELSAEDRKNMFNLFQSFAEKNGRGMAEAALAFAGTAQRCVDRPAFIASIESCAPSSHLCSCLRCSRLVSHDYPLAAPMLRRRSI